MHLKLCTCVVHNSKSQNTLHMELLVCCVPLLWPVHRFVQAWQSNCVGVLSCPHANNVYGMRNMLRAMQWDEANGLNMDRIML